MITSINITKEREGVRLIARKKRIWYPGAVYHVMERGIRRKEIYKDDIDYQVFMAIMKYAIEKNESVVHAYCMMTNHFHLLLETSGERTGKVHETSCEQLCDILQSKVFIYGSFV